MPTGSINSKFSQARVTDLAGGSPFTSGIDATHNAFQSIDGVPVFRTLAGAFALVTGSGPDPILTTKGDVLTYNGTADTRVGVGPDGSFFLADATQATGNKWGNTIAVPTATRNALILQTTDDNVTKNLQEWQSSAAAVLASVSAIGGAVFA